MSNFPAVLLLAAIQAVNLSPPAQRFIAIRQSGHNAVNDESAAACHLDYVRMRADDKSPWNLLFYVQSDPRSNLTFVGSLPADALPLREGASWNSGGKAYQYQRGTIETADGSFRLEIGAELTAPITFEGKDPLRPEHRLRCEFQE